MVAKEFRFISLNADVSKDEEGHNQISFRMLLELDGVQRKYGVRLASTKHDDITMNPILVAQCLDALAKRIRKETGHDLAAVLNERVELLKALIPG